VGTAGGPRLGDCLPLVLFADHNGNLGRENHIEELAGLLGRLLMVVMALGDRSQLLFGQRLGFCRFLLDDLLRLLLLISRVRVEVSGCVKTLTVLWENKGSSLY